MPEMNLKMPPELAGRFAETTHARSRNIRLTESPTSGALRTFFNPYPSERRIIAGRQLESVHTPGAA